jgi:Replication initiator protein A
MSKLLPDRHPNRDFFIIDIADAKPKDDMASMEHPVFSLSIKPDMRELEYTSAQGNRVRIVPSGVGLATIMDKDILLFCISKLMAEKQAGREITPWVEATAHEIMVATNWQTNDDSYRRFENAMLRLRGTTIITDVKTGGTMQSRGFGLIEEWDTVRKDASGNATPFGRQSKVRIKLSDWTFRAIQANEVLTIDRQYFRLRRPLERRLYEIARKHCGGQAVTIKFGIEKLQARVGSNAPLKKFRFNMKEIITDGNIPDYGFALVGDIVHMQRLVPMVETAPNWIPLRPDTMDRAQKIAVQLRMPVTTLEREWNEWAAGKGETLTAPDGAFIAFCKQKLGSQQASRYVTARKTIHEAVPLAADGTTSNSVTTPGEPKQLGFALDHVLKRVG